MIYIWIMEGIRVRVSVRISDFVRGEGVRFRVICGLGLGLE